MFDFIARPFGMLLNFLYEIIGSYGISLIIFTILAKLVLLPFQMKSKKSMIGMQKIQPKMKELEKKYKDDKERYAVAVQQLYKDEGVSMMGGCLPLLLTLPIMFGLYAVVRQPLTFMFGMGEAEIMALAEQANIAIAGPLSNFEIQIAAATEGLIDFSFLGLDLAATPSFSNLNILWIIPILSGLTSYGVSWISKKYQPAPQEGQPNTNMMTMLMPLMSVWIAFVVPGGLGFYWVVNNILSAVQEPALQWYYTKYVPNKK